LDDLQRDPAAAISKGWGFFSSALASATKEIRSSVVEPGLARAQQLAAEGGGDDWKKVLGQVGNTAKSAAGWAGQRAGEGWEGLNHVAKERGGLDLNEQLERLGVAGRSDGGYGRLERAEDGVVSPHGGRGDDDFFESWDSQPTSAASSSRPVAAAAPAAKKADKKDEWDKDDEWKDF
jgi:ADP-ribosylation factor GTPase-activating protein 1